MDMPPQQGAMGQNRSDSLTGEGKALPDNKKVPPLLQVFIKTLLISGSTRFVGFKSSWNLLHFFPSNTSTKAHFWV